MLGLHLIIYGNYDEYFEEQINTLISYLLIMTRESINFGIANLNK